jgi:hypothetical protein
MTALNNEEVNKSKAARVSAGWLSELHNNEHAAVIVQNNCRIKLLAATQLHVQFGIRQNGNANQDNRWPG